MKARWLIFLGTTLVAQYVMACSCIPSTRDEVINKSDIVFTGIVEEVTDAGKIEVGGSTRYLVDHFAARMRVVRPLKGKPSNPIIIYGTDTTEACGMDVANLKIGQELEIAPHFHNGKYWGNYCAQIGLTKLTLKQPVF